MGDEAMRLHEARRRIGGKIRELRRSRGIDQKGLGAVLCLNQSAISRIERGEQGIPAEQLHEVCRLFAVSADELLGLRYVEDRSMG